MAIKTASELYAQVLAIIRVNGNKEITPPLDKSIRDNFIASFVNVKDGGKVMQAHFGQLAYITPTDAEHYTPKQYVDDMLLVVTVPWGSITGGPEDNANLVTFIDTTSLALDGSNSPTADIDFGGFGIEDMDEIRDASGVTVLSNVLRRFYASNGAVFFDCDAFWFFGQGGQVSYDTWLREQNSADGTTSIKFSFNDQVRIYKDISLDDDTTAYYIGPIAVDGSWRTRIDGGDIIDEKRISGTWTRVDKSIHGTHSATGTATTTFTVTIGETMANTSYFPTISPSNALSAAYWYINNKTTTTFDVVYLAGLTGAVAFEWGIIK